MLLPIIFFFCGIQTLESYIDIIIVFTFYGVQSNSIENLLFSFYIHRF